jgi:hypothetical protein
MKKLLVVCLGILLLSTVALAAEAFTIADRVGEPGERSFFLFSTSAGNYVVRHDGMGEFSSPKGMRRVFRLSVKGRIDQVYFIEHEGDVFICYEVNETTFVVRMEQSKRKIRWTVSLGARGAPSIEGDSIIINDTQIRKSDGAVLAADSRE